MLTLTVFCLLLLSGFPVALTLMASVLVFIGVYDLSALLETMPVQFYGSIEKNGLLAIPLFMLVGEVMNLGGLTIRLMAAANVLVGRFRGGLAYVNLLTNAMAASILGSAVAQIAVMSKVMIPQMHDRGYDKGFAAALTIMGGLLGPIIPPSMLLIIYGVLAYQSISALFVAGIIPGLVLFLTFAVVIFIIGLRHNLPKEEWQPLKKSFPVLIAGLVPGLIPVIVIVGIVTGVMTPTESGAVASILAFFLGMCIYRNIGFSDIPGILRSVAINTAVITSLIAAASTFGWVLTFKGVPDMLVEIIAGTTNSPLVFLLLVNLLMLFLGMFIETISILIVIIPILLPVAESLGINLIHFGIIASLGTVIGLITPPVGPGLYIAMLEAKIPLKKILDWLVPFFIALSFAVAAINMFPALSTWLPQLFGLA